MILKSVGVLSVGKVFAILQGVFGLIAGIFFALFGMIGAVAGAGDGPEGFAAILFGGAALIILPIVYAVIGFIGGMIAALIYNVVAGLVGGIEMVLE